MANADVFWEQPILTKLLKDNHKIVMLSDKTRVDVGDYFLKTEKDMLVSFGKDLPLEERSSEYVGIAKIRKEYVSEYKANLENLISNEKYHLWWEDVLYLNIANSPIFVNDISEHFWSEVDYIEDYKRILKHIEEYENNIC